MFFKSSRGLVLSIVLCYVFMHINAQIQNGNENRDPMNINAPSRLENNDTGDDLNGYQDTEPLRNNGRGTHEANSQNYAAENNGTHGIPIEDFQQIILDQHNLYRRQMCANNLEMDESLHRLAEERAHSEANGKKLPLANNYNENVYEHDTGDPSTITGDMIVKAWFDQRQQYDVNNESSATGFTQLVWKKSTKSGVGHAYNGKKLYVVVLYQPSGNIRGQFAANVGCDATGQSNQATR